MNNFSDKAKKQAIQIARDMSMEVLGKRENKEQSPKAPKRSTMDYILGKNMTPRVDDRPSPIVEAMLQTKEKEREEDKMRAFGNVRRLGAEIDRERIKRHQEDMQRLDKLSREINASSQKKEEFVRLPSSPSKGPAAPKPGGGKGMEQVKTRK